MRRCFLMLLLCYSCFYGKGQEVEDLQKLITDMFEAMADQEIQNVDYEEMVNDLMSMSQNPINLNVAEKEDLERLFFLTDYQIENFLFYRYQNGALYSVFELQAVERLDSTTIQYMLPFVVVEPLDKKRKMRLYGQVLTRLQSTIETPMGYKAKNDTTPSAYLGSKEKWLSRGRLHIGHKAEVGFTLEKDQGERAFPSYFPAADFTSGFIQFNQPIKVINKWIIGDYRLSFGQGLGVWTDMAFSKSTETAQLRRRPKGINSYTSVNESSFLRGSAIKFKWERWSFVPFVSYKKRDASLLSDSLKEEQISSLQETGYHRTLGEMGNRHAVNELIYGVQSDYRHHLFHIDGGYVNWQVDESLEAKLHLKDKYRFKGDKQESMWLSHSIFLNRLTVFGEVVVQNYKEWGLFQGLTYNAGNDVVASLAYRKYSRAYTSILSNPFSESSTRGGESGVFASISFKPARQLNIKAFADLFSYDWLRYNVYRPSVGFEWFAQADYRLNYQNRFYLRYKSSQKEINAGEALTNYRVNSYHKDNIRLFYTHQPNEKWRLQTQLEHAFYKEEQERSIGWFAYQDVKFKYKRIFEIALRYAIFDIEDYNSRIYSYEPDVLYAFTVPSYMNKGTRVIMNFNIRPVNNLRIWFRLAQTNYQNLNEIGTGNQLIEGNTLTEYKVQMQYRF